MEEKKEVTDGLSAHRASDEAGGLGLSRLQFTGLPTQADKDAALEMAVHDLVTRDARNPVMTALAPADKRPARTVPSENGWRDAVPLGLPPGIALIDKMMGEGPSEAELELMRKEVARREAAGIPVPEEVKERLGMGKG